MAFSNLLLQLPPFTGKYYDVRAIKMTITLQDHDVWDYVQFVFSETKDEATEQALNNAKREQWKKNKKKNAQVLHLIQQ